MALISEGGKRYLKQIYQKLQVAIAVAVIRSRPENITTEEYVGCLKALISEQPPLLEDENTIPNEGDCHVGNISQQQEELFNKLWAVVPDSSDLNSTEEFTLGDKEMATSQDMFLCETESKNVDINESDNDEEADANVRFIEAIIQLKSIINSRSTISANKFKDVLELFLSPEELGQNKCITMRNKSWSNESISCCALGYVMRSSETNKLLCLSFERVLEYLGQSVDSLDWDGDDENSLIAHAMKTIRQLIDLASVGSGSLTYCLNASLKFVTSLVNQLKDGKDLNKASIWDRHCTLILELCKARYLSDKMISHIVETILKISEDLKNGLEQEKSMSDGCGCGPSFEPHSLENSWYMLYVLKKLITLKNETHQQTKDYFIPTSMSEVQHGEVCTIRDLWRLNWKGNDPEECAGNSLKKFYAEQDSFESSIVVKWKDQLNHYIKILSFHYPLFSYELYECEKLL